MRKIGLFIVFCLCFSSCAWFKTKPEIAVILAKHFNNKLFNKFDTAVYNHVFEAKILASSKIIDFPKTMRAFYKAKLNNPELVTQFYVNGSIDTLKNHVARIYLEGLNPEIFDLKRLSSLLEQLNANKFKTIDEVYPLIADLEIITANTLLKYNNCIKFGAVNPKKLFNRYKISIKRPDTTTIFAVLGTNDMVATLQKAQQTNINYVNLKKQLVQFRANINYENNRAIKIIKINLERLRWQHVPLGEEFVMVNIPDFSLTWFNKLDTLVYMKVCVGGKREVDYGTKMELFLKSNNLDDKPKNHETPQLISKINAIQVNPVWNIPVSIAQSEIYLQALKDPYYLSNSNIKVYYKGKGVKDPDTIQWRKYAREKLPFTFKQGSGENNALGKFKFIFENSASIYLHDTNNKNGFKLTNRAISHGCVRVEKPLEFAALLVKDKFAYDLLRMEVNLPPLDTTKMLRYKKILAKKADTLNVFVLKPKWFGVKKQIPLIINYLTAWSQNGNIEFRTDVYGYDEILLNAMKKLM